jgi:hypothetical protein
MMAIAQCSLYRVYIGDADAGWKAARQDMTDHKYSASVTKPNEQFGAQWQVLITKGRKLL